MGCMRSRISKPFARVSHLLREHAEVVLYGRMSALRRRVQVTSASKWSSVKTVFDTRSVSPPFSVRPSGWPLRVAAVVELQFVDFGMTAVHQILNNAGTTHYRQAFRPDDRASAVRGGLAADRSTRRT